MTPYIWLFYQPISSTEDINIEMSICQLFNFVLTKLNTVIAERVFTFLSADEVEKLKQEEERKMASLSRAELRSWSPGEDRQSGDSSHSDDEPYENGHR